MTSMYSATYYGGRQLRAGGDNAFAVRRHPLGMSITLYEKRGCPYCEKVADRLDELGVDYETVWVPDRHSEREQVKQISGQRQVPVFVDEEQKITMPESDRIIQYLNATYGEN